MALTAAEEALVRLLLDQQAAILSLAGNEATITSKLGATKVTLADLVAASGVSDADLMLVRQGTTEKSLTPALLRSFLGVTPAQFDNDTSLATTEFVQRALGSYRSTRTISAATTLDASDIGKVIICGGSGEYDVTLPAVAALPDGAGIILWCNATNAVNAKTPGADVMYYGQGSSSLTTFPIPQGGELELSKFTAAGWAAKGSVQLKYSAEFGSLLSANGYKKIPDKNSPSGFWLIQWGSETFQTAGGTVTFPIAFPNSVLKLYATADTPGAAATNIVSIKSLSLSQFIGYSNPANQLASYLAIGY